MKGGREMVWTIVLVVALTELIALPAGFLAYVREERRNGLDYASDMGAAIWVMLTCIGVAIGVVMIVNGWRV